VRIARLLRPAMWSYALQRSCTWYPLRRALATLAVAGKPSHTGDETESHALLGTLQRDGVAMLPSFIASDVIERIKRHLDGAVLQERFPPRRTGFTLDAVPVNVHVAEYDVEHVVRSPDVIAIANHPKLLETAARYLGCKPTISNLSIWWSFPADGTPQEAENYHRDVDDWRFVKFFLYLNDVDAGGGPHCFVRGSHRSWRFLRKRRLRDEQVAAAFDPADLFTISGNAGDAFLEDTFGLHKGQPPVNKRRLLFQVEYSVNPIAVYTYRPLMVTHANLALDRHINRLFVRAEDAASA
jgi:hypothetical protein